MATFTANVVFEHGGALVHFSAGDEVPEWASGLITNPDVTDDGLVRLEMDAVGAKSERPPEAGPGSGRDAWLAYAAFAGVEVPQDAKQKDIVAAVKEHEAAANSDGTGSGS